MLLLGFFKSLSCLYKNYSCLLFVGLGELVMVVDWPMGVHVYHIYFTISLLHIHKGSGAILQLLQLIFLFCPLCHPACECSLLYISFLLGATEDLYGHKFPSTTAYATTGRIKALTEKEAAKYTDKDRPIQSRPAVSPSFLEVANKSIWIVT